MLLRITIVVIALYLLYRLAKAGVKSFLLKPSKRQRKLKASGALIECAKCKTLVAPKLAWQEKDANFCSQACLLSFRAQKDKKP